MRPSPASPPMFRNCFVDAFSRTHFVTVPLLYLPAVAILLTRSVSQAHLGVAPTLGLSASGWALWTFVEYWLHRTVFHWRPESAWGRRFHFLIHGVHHEWPHDRYRLVMPPAVSITLFFLLLAAFRQLLGPSAWACYAGFVLGYTYYDLMHYHLHHGRPTSDHVKRLRKHHLLHHFKSHTMRFGVSTQFWDRVFGTLSAAESSAVRAGPRPHPAER